MHATIDLCGGRGNLSRCEGGVGRRRRGAMLAFMRHSAGEGYRRAGRGVAKSPQCVIPLCKRENLPVRPRRNSFDDASDRGQRSNPKPVHAGCEAPGWPDRLGRLYLQEEPMPYFVKGRGPAVVQLRRTPNDSAGMGKTVPGGFCLCAAGSTSSRSRSAKPSSARRVGRAAPTSSTASNGGV
jgi:hypothetical protein